MYLSTVALCATSITSRSKFHTLNSRPLALKMSTQKALVLPQPQASWSLVSDFPIDPIGPKDVRIKVVTAALNPADWKIQAFGTMGITFTWPFVGGLDGAGIIVDVGEDVTNKVLKGDKVYALTGSSLNW